MAFNPKSFLKKSPTPASQPHEDDLGFKDEQAPTQEDITEKLAGPKKISLASNQTAPTNHKVNGDPSDGNMPEPEATPQSDSGPDQEEIDQPVKDQPTPSDSDSDEPEELSSQPQAVAKDKDETTKKTSSTSANLPVAQKVEFYAMPIRMIRLENEWFFVLFDLLPLAKIPSTTKYLDHLSHYPDLEPKWSDVTREITFLEDGSEVTETCADKNGVLEIITHMDEKFPGPFSRWIGEVVKLQAVQLSPEQPSLSTQVPTITQ